MKKYNSFLGAFFSGDNGQGGYNAAYGKSALAKLYTSQDPAEKEMAFQGLTRIDPQTAVKYQQEQDAMRQENLKRKAMLIANAPAAQRGQLYASVLPDIRKDWADAPDVYDANIDAMVTNWAKTVSGSTNQNTGVQSTFISGGKLHYLTRDGKPVNTGIEVDDRYTLEIDPQNGMPYRFGSRRGVLESVDGVDNGGQQPAPVTQKNPPSGGGGIVFPEDIAGAAQRTSDVMKQVRKEIDDLMRTTGMSRDEATNQVTQKYARQRGLTMPPQGQQPAPVVQQSVAPTVVQQPIRQSSGYRGMSAAEKARAEAEAKAAVELQYAPQVEGAKARSKADVEIQTAPQIEGAKAAAVETAKRTAINVADAPKFITTADQTLAVIDKAINHPGRAGATGMSAALPWQYAYGTKERDFITVSQQLEGKTFLQAFESLKGGGAITEMEGQAATKAIARLDRAQTEGEYLAALNELRQIVVDARNRAVQAMRGNRAPAPAGGHGKSNYSSLWGD